MRDRPFRVIDLFLNNTKLHHISEVLQFSRNFFILVRLHAGPKIDKRLRLATSTITKIKFYSTNHPSVFHRRSLKNIVCL